MRDLEESVLIGDSAWRVLEMITFSSTCSEGVKYIIQSFPRNLVFPERDDPRLLNFPSSPLIRIRTTKDTRQSKVDPFKLHSWREFPNTRGKPIGQDLYPSIF
jgi:hypothetical protein